MGRMNIEISSDDFRTVTPDELRFQKGDSVVISAAEDAPSVLVFSSSVQAILDPNPGPQLTVNSAQARTFTFKSADPGTYRIAVAVPGGFIGNLVGSSNAPQVGGSAANLKFEVVGPAPEPPPPPPMPGSSGPVFHPNSGG